MTQIATPSLALAITCGTLAGLVVGLVYFALLRRAVAGYVKGAQLKGPLLLTALRLAAVLIVFFALVQWSAAAAVAGLVGFTLALLTLRFTVGLD